MLTEISELPEPFVPLTSADALDDLFRRSNDEPVIVFKHSSTCPISSAAYREMRQLSRDVAIIVLQNYRDISIETERRTGVRHESPQVIIVRNGAAVWNASNWNIKSDAVESAFRVIV